MAWNLFYRQFPKLIVLNLLRIVEKNVFCWWICRKCLSSKRHILRIANILFSVRILFTRKHRTIQRWLNTLLDVMIVCSKFNRNIRYCPGFLHRNSSSFHLSDYCDDIDSKLFLWGHTLAVISRYYPEYFTISYKELFK